MGNNIGPFPPAAGGGGGGGSGAAGDVICYTLGGDPAVWLGGAVHRIYDDAGVLVTTQFYDEDGNSIAEPADWNLGECCNCEVDDAGPQPRFELLVDNDTWSIHDAVISFSFAIISNPDQIDISDGVGGNQTLPGVAFEGYSASYGVNDCKQFLRNNGFQIVMSATVGSQAIVSWTECDDQGGGGGG